MGRFPAGSTSGALQRTRVGGIALRRGWFRGHRSRSRAGADRRSTQWGAGRALHLRDRWCSGAAQASSSMDGPCAPEASSMDPQCLPDLGHCTRARDLLVVPPGDRRPQRREGARLSTRRDCRSAAVAGRRPSTPLPQVRAPARRRLGQRASPSANRLDGGVAARGWAMRLLSSVALLPRPARRAAGARAWPTSRPSPGDLRCTPDRRPRPAR